MFVVEDMFRLVWGLVKLVVLLVVALVRGTWLVLALPFRVYAVRKDRHDREEAAARGEPYIPDTRPAVERALADVAEGARRGEARARAKARRGGAESGRAGSVVAGGERACGHGALRRVSG